MHYRKPHKPKRGVVKGYFPPLIKAMKRDIKKLSAKVRRLEHRKRK